MWPLILVPHAVLPLLLLLVFGSTPECATANGLRIVSQDAFAAARGEAFVATADNPSAVYYNPAGVAHASGLESRSTFYQVYVDATYQPSPNAPNAGNSYQNKEKFALIPQFFATYRPTNSPAAIGFGVYAPFGGRTSWPQDTGFRTVATKSSLTYLTIHPAVAWRFDFGLSLGAGLTVSYGKIDVEQGLLRTSTPFSNYFRFVGDGWTLGYNVGALWRPSEVIAFGATFRSPTRLTAVGQTGFEQQPIIQPTVIGARANYNFPLSAVLGVSFRPTPEWNVEINADYTDWTRFNSTTIEQAVPPPFPVQQDIDVKLGWEPSWLYEFGATRYFDDGWQLSAGYVYSENSVPDDYYSPAAADLDRHVLSLGGGHSGPRIRWDVTYQFAYGPTRTVSGSTPSAQPAQFAGQTADGRYRFISHGLLVSLTMKFK